MPGHWDKAAEPEAHKARIEWYYRRALGRSEGRRLKGSANPQDHPAVLPGLALGQSVGWAGEWGSIGHIVEPAAQDEFRVSTCPKPQKVPGWRSLFPENCCVVWVAKTPNEKEEPAFPPPVPSAAPGTPRPLLAPRGRLNRNLRKVLPEWRPN